jgi:pimeloyl-ACP methyl ester carboxylesterase
LQQLEVGSYPKTSNMTEHQFRYQDKSIFYRTSGEGLLVLLLHGFGEDGTVWKNQFDALPGVKIVVPDLPGSGRSEAIADMSMEGLAGVLSALVQEITSSEEKIVLIGHSMGGYIALAFAEKYPQKLSGLGLFHSSAFADSEEKKETRQKAITFIRDNGGAAFLKTAIPKLYAPATQENKAHLVEDHISSTHNFSDAALVSYYESMIKRPDRTAVLKSASVPVLMILGKFDTAIPFEDGLKQTHMPDLSYIHVLEKAGHMGMIEMSQESNKILQDFITLIQARTDPE